jgi:hypothetical protein
LHPAYHFFYFLLIGLILRQRGSLGHCSAWFVFLFHHRSLPTSSCTGVGFAGVKGASAQVKGASIYFFASAQVASVGCICSVIVHFLHCICVCDCDGCHKSLIVLSRSVMVRRSHLLAQCYLGTMCMCTTYYLNVYPL